MLYTTTCVRYFQEITGKMLYSMFGDAVLRKMRSGRAGTQDLRPRRHGELVKTLRTVRKSNKLLDSTQMAWRKQLEMY